MQSNYLVSKRTVLLLVHTLGLGGTEKSVQIFAKYLQAAGFSVHVGGWQEGGPREKLLRAIGVKTVIFHKDQEALRLYINENVIGIVHLHYVYIPLDCFGSTRLLFHHHFSKPLYTQTNQERFSLIIFNSYRTRQKFFEITKQTFNPSKHVVLYSPIDFQDFDQMLESVTKRDIQTYKRKLKIPLDAHVIGRLGRADVVKWSDFIIESFPRLFRLIPDLYIILQSVPRSRSLLLKLSTYSTHLRMLPNDPVERSVAMFMKTIDIYTHTSKIGESLGLTIVEAMACGKPIVVNSTPDVDNAQIEIVENGKTGYVVPDPQGFASAVDAIFREDKVYKNMSIEARKFAYDNFDASLLTKTLASYYAKDLSAPQIKKNEHAWILKNEEYQERSTDLYTTQITHLEKIINTLNRPIHFLMRCWDVIEFKFLQ